MTDPGQDANGQDATTAQLRASRTRRKAVRPISLAGEIRKTAEYVLLAQRRQAADTVQGVADTLRQTADQLEQQRVPALAEYADRAARTIEHWSDAVRHGDLDAVVEDTGALIRRQPVLFLAGAAAAGFLIGRLLKASDDHAAGRMDPTA